MMKINLVLFFIFPLIFFSGNAQDSCTPIDHPSNANRTKGFMDAGGQIVANDFLITANTLNFSLTQVEANLWTEEGEIDYLDVIIYDNEDWHPGNIVSQTMGIVPTSQAIIDMDPVNNYEIRKVILDIASEVNLAGTGTEPVKYWLQLVAYPSIPGKRVGWELNGDEDEVQGEGVNFSNPSIDYWMVNEFLDGVFALHGICTKTEGCQIPETVTALDIQTNEATIAWVGNEDAETYMLEYGLQGFEPGTGEGTVLELPGDQTTVTLTDLEMVTYYDVYIKSVCQDGESIYTVPFTFLTIDLYCMIGNLDTIEPITYVDFAGIENRSPSGLNQVPAHEYFLDIQGEVVPGQTYTIAVEGNTGGDYGDGITVYFDWDQNGEFNETTERYDIGILTNSTGTDGQQVNATITVPQNAQVGLTRMRIMKEFFTYMYIYDSCSWISYGQAEDYGIMVGTLGTENQAVTEVKIYPNPMTDILHIQTAEKISSVEIYNMIGQLMTKKEVQNAQENLEVSHLNSGIYLVKVKIGDRVETFKVVKK